LFPGTNQVREGESDNGDQNQNVQQPHDLIDAGNVDGLLTGEFPDANLLSDLQAKITRHHPARRPCYFTFT